MILKYFFVTGNQGSGKTTMCTILNQIRKEYNDQTFVSIDLDKFLVKKIFDYEAFISTLEQLEDKIEYVIFCGIISFYKYLTDFELDIFYIDLSIEDSIHHCVNRFFSKLDIERFFKMPLLNYLHVAFEGCSKAICRINKKEKIHVNTYGLTLEKFESNQYIIEKILNEIDSDLYKEINIETYINLFLRKQTVRNVSLILLKFILLLVFYLPSILINPVFISFPIFAFFFNTYYILEVINLFLLIILLQKTISQQSKQYTLLKSYITTSSYRVSNNFE